MQSTPLTDAPAADPNTPLRLRLFGPFSAGWGERPLPRLRTRKEQGLLALLVLRSPRAVERVWLAGTLWPDSAERDSLANLRRSLVNLRDALGPDADRLHSPAPGALAFRADGADVDVLRFDAACARGDREAVQQAVSLYRGPLLEDCTEDWAAPERSAREEAFLEACERLAALLSGENDSAGAVRVLRRALEIDPLRETALRALMDTLADAGNPAGALEVFRRFRRHLRREMDAAPAAETRALFARIGAGLSPVPAPASSRLPVPLTALVGRGRELEDIVAHLDTARLVTLTGAGGVGKTRLALAAAADAAQDGAGEVSLAALAPLTSPALLVSTLARALEIAAPCETPDALVGLLRDRPLLLLLDNCEHLMPECAALTGALLENCPSLRVLATSRQPLGLPGETVYPLSPLPCPPPHPGPSAKPETDYEAVQLFIARARQARPSFAADPRTLPSIAHLCRRLDGLPLALELAAARVRSLSCEQIAQKMDDRFGLLTVGNHAALPRHQTLRAAVDWSYDLLSETERALLARLSVFAGGWTLGAAEAVCAGGCLDAPDVLGALSALTDKSLVQMREGSDGAARYHLLETLREYAREKLAHSGETDFLRVRHRGFFLALAEDAGPKLSGPEQAFWMERLETEHDNLRAALDGCARDEGDAPAGLRLAVALWRFWYVRGYLTEGRRRLEQALRFPVPGADALRARALTGAGNLAFAQGDTAAAQARLAECQSLYQALGDREGFADSHLHLGNVFYSQQDYAAAQRHYQDALTLYRELEAEVGIATSLINLGLIDMDQDRYPSAQAFYEEGLALCLKIGNRQYVMNALINLGQLASAQGQSALALARYAEALRVCREFGSRMGYAYALEGMAREAGAVGQFERAGRLWGAAEVAWAEIGAPFPSLGTEEYERNTASARAALGEDGWAQSWAAGRALTTEQAVDYALQGLPNTT